MGKTAGEKFRHFQKVTIHSFPNTVPKKLTTIKSYVSELYKTLGGIYSVDEAKAVAIYYVTGVLNLSNTEFVIRQSEFLTDEELAKLNSKSDRLIAGEPVQYIVEKAYFYGLSFYVDKNVLIPRQETEILVDTIIKKYQSAEKLRILDIGTGSGCIAISLKKNLPESELVALDISPGALSVCKKNASLNNLEIETLNHDILSENRIRNLEKFDIIVSNPPYVLPSEMLIMHKNVVDFEPSTALYVPQDNPLLFYRQIALISSKLLKERGVLFFEINENFALEVIELNKSFGFKNHEIIQDLNNKQRFVVSSL